MKTNALLILLCCTAIERTPFAQVAEGTPSVYREIPSRAVPSRVNAGRYHPDLPGTPSAPEENLIKFSVKFPGGTPVELIEQLRKALGENPNVMISPAMEDVHLPKFELENVTLNDVFKALNQLAAENIGGSWQLSGSGQPIWVLTPAPKGMGVNPFPGPHGTAIAQTSAAREVRILSMAPYLPEYSIDDITTACQTAWGMMSNAERPAQVKFHVETKLLILVGTAQQLAVATQVLSSLDQSKHINALNQTVIRLRDENTILKSGIRQ